MKLSVHTSCKEKAFLPVKTTADNDSLQRQCHLHFKVSGAMFGCWKPSRSQCHCNGSQPLQTVPETLLMTYTHACNTHTQTHTHTHTHCSRTFTHTNTHTLLMHIYTHKHTHTHCLHTQTQTHSHTQNWPSPFLDSNERAFHSLRVTACLSQFHQWSEELLQHKK